MISRTGSVINLRGERREEGLVLCFDMRGEPDELLGESGGALPAGNMEGNALLPGVFTFKEFPWALKEAPAFASSIRDLTCIHVKAARDPISKDERKYGMK